MFDFLPVGGPLDPWLAWSSSCSSAGGRALGKQAGIAGFETGSYLTEVRIPEDSKVVDMTLREVERTLDGNRCRSSAWCATAPISWRPGRVAA